MMVRIYITGSYRVMSSKSDDQLWYYKNTGTPYDLPTWNLNYCKHVSILQQYKVISCIARQQIMI